MRASDRSALTLLTALLLAPLAALRADNAENAPWYRQNPRTFLVDVQFPDPVDQGVEGMPRFLEKVDPRRIVEQVKAAHATAIIVHAKCEQGNAYYNTRFGHKHSGIGDRDLLREFTKAAREAGLKLIYYYALSQDPRYWDEHPDHRAMEAPGKPRMWYLLDDARLISRDRKIAVCLNGPFREYVKNMTGELAQNYDFDGFWLDWGSLWASIAPCYCEFCAKHYKSATGCELPAVRQGPDWEKYIRWRRELNASVQADIIGNIKSIKPNLTVTANDSAFSSYVGWNYADSPDYLCREYHFHDGMAVSTFSSLKQRALKPDAPFEIESWRFCCEGGGGRAFQVKTLPALLTEMAPVVAHGGFPQYYDQLRVDGTLDQESLDVAGRAFAEVASRQPWSRIGHPVTFAQILWSKETEVFGKTRGTAAHGAEMVGFQRALMESHLPVELISERDAASGAWRGARVIILPSAQCLSDKVAASVAEFVRQGGGLVVTALTSTDRLPWENAGVRDASKNFALADVLGVDFDGISPNIYDFVSMDAAHPITAGLSRMIPLTARDSQLVTVLPRAGTLVLGTLVKDTPGWHMGSMPGRRTDQAVLTATTFGKGRVVYCGMPAGHLYVRYGHHDHRTLINNAVLWAANAKPSVTAETHETVEIVPWHDTESGRTVVHLINRTGAGPARGPGIQQHEAIPVHDITLRVRRDLAGDVALAQPGGRRLKMNLDGDWASVTIDKLNIWEVVEFKK